MPPLTSGAGSPHVHHPNPGIPHLRTGYWLRQLRPPENQATDHPQVSSVPKRFCHSARGNHGSGLGGTQRTPLPAPGIHCSCLRGVPHAPLSAWLSLPLVQPPLLLRPPWNLGLPHLNPGNWLSQLLPPEKLEHHPTSILPLVTPYKLLAASPRTFRAPSARLCLSPTWATSPKLFTHLLWAHHRVSNALNVHLFRWIIYEGLSSWQTHKNNVKMCFMCIQDMAVTTDKLNYNIFHSHTQLHSISARI